MKAFYQLSYKKSVPSVFGDLPDAVAGENEILVSVKATSVNPVDYKLKNGDARIITGSKFPRIVGSDFAGIVKEPSKSDTRFKVGDRVYGAVSLFTGKTGALAELVAADPKRVRHIPFEMSFEQASSLPVAALTALNGLRRCSVASGTKLLINGATGGVGHFAVQIARSKGAVITATCNETNSELARQLGADKTSRYSKEDLAKYSSEYDAILDAYGKMKFSEILRLLKKGGIYASPLILFAPAFLTYMEWLFTSKKITSSNMRALPEDFEEIERLFLQDKLKPVIENIYPLEKAAEAFKMAEFGRPRGKVIITV